MRLDWNSEKERRNIQKHGLDFSLAAYVLKDPLRVDMYDRYEGGEHRYHSVAVVGGRFLVLVHAYPDSDKDDWVRVIGLRVATKGERRRYEQGDRDDR